MTNHIKTFVVYLRFSSVGAKVAINYLSATQKKRKSTGDNLFYKVLPKYKASFIFILPLRVSQIEIQ